jgi:hypothetical protein
MRAVVKQRLKIQIAHYSAKLWTNSIGAKLMIGPQLVLFHGNASDTHATTCAFK